MFEGNGIHDVSDEVALQESQAMIAAYNHLHTQYEEALERHNEMVQRLWSVTISLANSPDDQKLLKLKAEILNVVQQQKIEEMHADLLAFENKLNAKHIQYTPSFVR